MVIQSLGSSSPSIHPGRMSSRSDRPLADPTGGMEEEWEGTIIDRFSVFLGWFGPSHVPSLCSLTP